jgi:nucleoside-diphosphate-sugar epimerase
MSYGTQKLMVELALADAARRGVLDPLCVRLPGVVARPYAASGLVSAFMSNLFHALAADEEIVLPVSPTGRAWLMSVDTAVANLLHAARVDTASLGVRRAITLPAVHATIHDLANSIGKACAVDAEARVRYDKVEDVEAQFAAYPPLFARQALALGFHDDATLAALTSRVLRRIKNSAEEN